MKIKTRLLGIALLLTTVIMLIVMSGCFSTTVATLGWSGVRVDGENLYFTSATGNLVGLNKTTLAPLWSPVVLQGTTTSGGFGCSSGSVAVSAYGTPVVYQNAVYIAGYNGKVYRIIPSPYSANSQFLNANRPQPIVGGLALAGEKIYTASDDGKVYALDAASLNQAWSYQTGDKIWSTPAVDNGIVYVGSFDKKVYALDATSGAFKWSYPTQGAITATPLIYDGKVYVASLDRHIYALDSATGALLWQYPAVSAGSPPDNWFWTSPVLAGGILYAPNMDGKVYALQSQNGQLMAAMSVNDAVVAAPVIAAGKVITVNQSGQLYSLDATASQPVTLLLDLSKEAASTGLLVRAPLTSEGDMVYIHTLNPEKIYTYNSRSNQLAGSPYTVG